MNDMRMAIEAKAQRRLMSLWSKDMRDMLNVLTSTMFCMERK